MKKLLNIEIVPNSNYRDPPLQFDLFRTTVSHLFWTTERNKHWNWWRMSYTGYHTSRQPLILVQHSDSLHRHEVSNDPETMDVDTCLILRKCTFSNKSIYT